MLLNHVGDHFAENNQPHDAALYFQKAKEALKHSERIKAVIHEHEKAGMEKIEAIQKKQEVQGQVINNFKLGS